MKNLSKSLICFIAFCLFIIFLPNNTQAQVKPVAKAGTWTGEVVDLECYITRGAKGKDHASYAQTCIKNGQPMGLLTDDGTLVLIAKDNSNVGVYDKLKEMAGSKVDITGKLAERDGMKILVVNQVTEKK